MLKRLALIIVVIALFATAVEATGIYSGKRGRKYVRRTCLVNYWTNDKLRIYEENGFPIHRYRVKAYGRVLEHWKYYELGKEFIFDEDSNLVKTNTFWPEDRRERIERF